MASKVQFYKVPALIASLPTFFLRDCEHLLACFIFLAGVTNVPTVSYVYIYIFLKNNETDSEERKMYRVVCIVVSSSQRMCHGHPCGLGSGCYCDSQPPLLHTRACNLDSEECKS